jgi:hypothetical protein
MIEVTKQVCDDSKNEEELDLRLKLLVIFPFLFHPSLLVPLFCH